MNVPYRDAQMQLGFIIYMMAGSYFGRTVCRTPAMAAKMQSYYNTMRPADQIGLEQECDQFVLREVIPNLPSQMINGRVDVFLYRDAVRGGKARVFFTDGFSVIEISAEQTGKRTTFRKMLCIAEDAYDSAAAASA